MRSSGAFATAGTSLKSTAADERDELRPNVATTRVNSRVKRPPKTTTGATMRCYVTTAAAALVALALAAPAAAKRGVSCEALAAAGVSCEALGVETFEIETLPSAEAHGGERGR